MFQDEIGGGESSVVAVMGGEGVFHGAPFCGAVGKDVGDGFCEVFGVLREIARTELLEEAEIPLLLAGNEVVDEHGAAGGDGLVDGGSASLTDDEVVLVEELRDFSRPSEKTNTSGIRGLDLAGARLKKSKVFAHHDG